MDTRTMVVGALLAALVTSGADGVHAQSLPAASPESVGLSSSKLALATERLAARVVDGDIAGAVAGVVRRGKLVYLEAVGYRDLESRTPMPEDALFRMYSMTRPITSLAALMLVDDGDFRLEDPIVRYLPEFDDQETLTDPDGASGSATRPRRGNITVEHLLLHTSGLGSRSSALYRELGVRSRSISLETMVANAARAPLFEDPGTRWRYGISTTILGRLIEVGAEQPLERFLDERIFTPLGMADTVFWADPSREPRLARVYRRDPDSGRLVPHAIEDVPFTERPALVEGGVGLLSTTEDFLRFSQLFLDGGVAGGRRLLSAESLNLMTENRVPDALMPIGFGRPMRGAGWSLGFCVVVDPRAYDYPMNEGEFWWDGSAGTRFWIDPVHEMITIVNAQISPAGGGGFREEFKALVYDAIVEP